MPEPTGVLTHAQLHDGRRFSPQDLFQFLAQSGALSELLAVGTQRLHFEQAAESGLDFVSRKFILVEGLGVVALE